ncbi:TPA: methionine--tRNA ligase subunit beta [Patescibacteria group bacterium]|nr:MAG: Methionine-tRNA ligase [Parcubacteria group bacterium GW2011_GWF2_40_10]KKR47201.1 MAG: Methionine-tRNA ligase [Parcubacteria group bacterium GW2011_GWA2_40_143]KKR60166.1 MAG: Methionine-tRNA ligase [Parcubacteria group bacterium GW2011_GWC2_40_31]KKR74836.1 MAG: Methionine-tRNA ligase [Parcubacteria group bacterium GW2011_GWB2_40_8]KKR76265.1 MAG: Methionine-tRNA ligase [Parcubacteria group bacterium GW2011_GWE2_40_8]KKR80467.1 MAG: Methionine-tRNA ligase [Parcubacteria group bacteri
MINFDDFQKIEIKVGGILSAEKVEGSEKLLKLSVDFGEEIPRQVVSGIAKTFTTPEILIGKQFIFITNLEPRKIMGLESQAMILATHKKFKDGSEEIVLTKPAKKVLNGSRLG